MRIPGLGRARLRWSLRPTLRRVAGGALLAAVGPGILAGGFVLGFGLPSFGSLPRIRGGAGLDYGTLGGVELPPLRDPRIADLLAEPTSIGPGKDGGLHLIDGDAAPFDRHAIAALSNDDFSNAASVTSVPFAATTVTTGATRQSGEHTDCTAIGGTVWFRYTAGRTMGLSADTFGSDYAATIEVYRGTDLRSLVALACNSDRRGNAVVTFPATKGTTYYIQIAAELVSGGHLLFALVPQGDSFPADMTPAHDGPVSAPAISGDGRFMAFPAYAHGYAGPCTTPTDVTCPTEIYVMDLATRRVTLATKTPSGAPANGYSSMPAFSSDGRYVVFSSSSTDLMPGLTGLPCVAERPGYEHGGACRRVYVLDRATGRLRRISVGALGIVDDGDSVVPTISGDGNVVAYVSDSGSVCHGASVVPACYQVYVTELGTGATELISQDAQGMPGLGDSQYPSLSADGRYVSFDSGALHLLPGKLAPWNVYVRDRQAHRTMLASVSSSGQPGDDQSLEGCNSNGSSKNLSADGRYVLFQSMATNLVPGHGDHYRIDFYVHDIKTGKTVAVTDWSEGRPIERDGGADTNGSMAISANGRYVAFDLAVSSTSGLTASAGSRDHAVYIHDILTDQTVVASVGHDGSILGGDSPSLSDDGHGIAFLVGDISSDSDQCLFAASNGTTGFACQTRFWYHALPALP